MTNSPRLVAVALFSFLTIGCSVLGDDTSSSGTEFSAESSSVRGALNLLPVLPADVGGVEVSYTDWAGLAEAAGLGSLDAVSRDDFVSHLVVSGPLNDGGTGLVVRQAQPANDALAYGELEAVYGFGVNEVSASVEVTALPLRFGLFVGPEGWAGEVESFAGELQTYGQGEDLELNLDASAPGRPYGNPLRVAASDGVLAASLSTPLLEHWLSGSTPTYGDDPAFMAVAEVLDEVGVLQATIFESDFSGGAEAVITEPFSVLAIAGTVVDGRAREVVAYTFADEDAAASAVESVEDVWKNGTSLWSDQTFQDLAPLLSVEQQGRVVFVVTEVPEGSVGGSLTLLFKRDLVMMHR